MLLVICADFFENAAEVFLNLIDQEGQSQQSTELAREVLFAMIVGALRTTGLVPGRVEHLVLSARVPLPRIASVPSCSCIVTLVSNFLFWLTPLTSRIRLLTFPHGYCPCRLIPEDR